jgi:hypothetical protein
VRLADGRFVVLSEGNVSWTGNGGHPALLFPDDPAAGAKPQAFTFAGPPGYRPTDMAQLPDGRVLVLMRRLLWPFPMRFAGCLVLADPAGIAAGRVWHGQELARLEAPLPVDNFEAMAITPAADGQLAVWLMSDANAAQFQRTLLWQLILDPAALPATQKAHDPAVRPSAIQD